MIQRDASVLLTPSSEELRFLPEGPYRNPNGMVSWVSIQHGKDSQVGAVNLLDLESLENKSFEHPGRPGFAFPTDRDGVFVVGAEHSLWLFDTNTRQSRPFVDGIDQGVSGTVVNDGLCYDGHLIFGCKDLQFADHKAGLYLLRAGETELIQLDDKQLCSNGKFIIADGDTHTLYDIDTPTQKITACEIDFAAGKRGDVRTVVDLSDGDVYPDGMILTPDQKSLIVAIFNPHDATVGEARQYCIATGMIQAIWNCPGSPRVTCPQLIEHDGGVKLLLTTADEGMDSELRAKNPNAGCLFIADTDFNSLNDNPVYPIPSGLA
ncbi:MAG: SMP-30/gluconolactonase/LRE family protein [Pirellulaceae bacterium]|nr:SMP-30/gluconolactonase/LRE family protein [Pirellulaceae bacterium]